MSKTSLIIKREYLTRVKKKSFLILTFVAPLLFVGVMVGAILIGISDNTDHYVLIEDTQGVFTKEINGKTLPLNPERWENAKDSSMVYEFSRNELSPEDFKESDFTLKITLDGENLNSEQVPMMYKDLPSGIVKTGLERKLQDEYQELTVKTKLDITPEQYRSAKVDIRLLEQDVENLDETDTAQRERGGIGLAFAVMIYMFIFLFGSQVMRGVIEEKTNRIVEVLISSVKPFQLMLGKVIGVALVGLTQFLLWIGLTSLLGFIALTIIPTFMDPAELAAQAENGANMMQDNPALSLEALKENKIGRIFFSANWSAIIGAFIFFFLGGYFLYGSLFAAIGAAVDGEADTQQFMAPVTIPLIFGLIIAEMAVFVNPESTAATFFSLFPLTSPIVMLVRVAMGNVEMWEFALSALLLILTFLGTIWLAGKIYRTGILMYGKKVSYKELWKWLKY